MASWRCHLSSFHAVLLCLLVADPATFPASHSVLRPSFLHSLMEKKYIWVCVITSLIFWVWRSSLKLQGAPLRATFTCFPLSQDIMIGCSAFGGHQSPECAAGQGLCRFQEQSLSLMNWALLGVPPIRLSNQQVLTGNPNTSSLQTVLSSFSCVVLVAFTHLEHTRPCSSASTRSCCCSRRSPSRRTPRTSWWRCCSNTEEWRPNTCLCPEDPGRAQGQLWQKTQRTWGTSSCVIRQCFAIALPHSSLHTQRWRSPQDYSEAARHSTHVCTHISLGCSTPCRSRGHRSCWSCPRSRRKRRAHTAWWSCWRSSGERGPGRVPRLCWTCRSEESLWRGDTRVWAGIRVASQSG